MSLSPSTPRRRAGLAAAAVLLTMLGSRLAAPAQAQAPSRPTAVARLLAEAARASGTGAHDDAARLYEAAVSGGASDPAVHFNLGNAWLAAGAPGRAAVAYARAAALTPRDADIRHNRAALRAQLPPALAGTPATGWRGAVAVSQTWIGMADLGRLALAAWWALAAAAIASRRARPGAMRRIARLVATAAAAVLMACGAAAAAWIADARTQPAAFVVEAVPVSDGPGSPEELRTVAELPAGVEVRILERRRDWVRLAWPGTDGDGWVPARAVEAVAPAN